MEWILASASPRRKELLGQLVEKFDIIPSCAEEVVEGNPDPETLVKMLAKQKAAEVATREIAKGKIVLGSDTVVALDGKVLGKPKDEAEAFLMLSALSNRTHEVFTGVCFSYPCKDGGREEYVDVACTKVVFERLTKEQIEEYIATGSPMDKAGAYGIQDGGLVKSIEGSFSNVVGLPIELCADMMKKIEQRTK
ncbi:MAG: septum formation protein Maf [Clostridiales bacterium]|nr:septum formation protein Maf [Clostridiales bacterium]